MPIEVHSATLRGIEGCLLRVEVDILSLLPTFLIVGLPHSSVREARERVRSAIRSADLPFPRRRITVNLAPADLPKHGTGLDLPIALGVVAAAWNASHARPAWERPPFALGELGLDGDLHPIRGVLPLVEAARRQGIERVLVPLGNVREAGLVPGIEVLGVRDLGEAWKVARGAQPSSPAPEPGGRDAGLRGPDLAEVRGLAWGRRVLEVAAAGGHGLLLEGPPGSGKSMLARCLASLLPDLDEEAALEVTRIRSASGLLPEGGSLVVRPPLRAPHHTASSAAMIGGGRPVRPGEITLAHRGVLLLDELPEFPRAVLEALRQPLQDGSVVVARRDEVLDLPADFQLVATRNPCPCGMAGRDDSACVCSPAHRDRYRARVSGPLLDRIELVAWIDPVEPGQLLTEPDGEASTTIRRRVEDARACRRARESEVRRERLLAHRLTVFGRTGRAELERILRSSRCSSRAVKQLVAIALTLTDLSGLSQVTASQVQEAALLCTSEQAPSTPLGTPPNPPSTPSRRSPQP